MAFKKKVPAWYAAGTEPPDSLKQKGFEAGYKPPADFFNWFFHGASEALKELQNMIPADIGAEKALYLGGEPVTAVSDDTFAKWTQIGTGYAFYGVHGLLNNQPSQYGCLLNIVTASNIVQLWFSLPQGTMYYRGGNTSGLSTSWTKVLNSAQISEILLDKLGGTLSIEKGGTGKTNAIDAFCVLARRNNISSSNLVNADTLTSPGIYQVYFEGAATNPADYNFPYAYGVLVVNSTVSYVGQLFYAVSINRLWYRTRATTSSPWGSWACVYDTRNQPALTDLPGILLPEHGGTGETTTEAAYQKHLTRATINNENIINANTLTTSGAHMVYIENDGTYDHLTYNFPYKYGILFVVKSNAYVAQAFYAVSADYMFYRSSYNGGTNWTDWKTIYTDKNLPISKGTEDLEAGTSPLEGVYYVYE